MKKGIQMVKPGVSLGDIGSSIQTLAEKNNCSIVREYCGHGIGKEFHEDPQVLHYGKPNTGLKLEQGMTFTIEPMVNLGKRQVKLLAKTMGAPDQLVNKTPTANTYYEITFHQKISLRSC